MSSCEQILLVGSGLGQTLSGFLEEQLLPWQIPLALADDGIKVKRSGNELTPTLPNFPLNPGDIVKINYARFDSTLRKEASTNYRDYCFVPNKYADNTITIMQELMETRSQSTRLTIPVSLEKFIEELSGRSIINPIRHLYIGAHANDAGDIFMKLQDTVDSVITQETAILKMAAATGIIDFETLEAAEKHDLLKIDQKLLEPRPLVAGQSITTEFRIRGCRIGKAKPFLDQLKKALGGNVTVNAPKHFEHVAKLVKSKGYLEYMEYDFQTRRPKAYPNKEKMLEDFLKGGFTDIDGKPIAPALIRAGILPVNAQKQGQTPTSMMMELPSGITDSINTPLGFRYRIDIFRSDWSAFPLAVDPVTFELRMAKLKNEFMTQVGSWPLFAKAHPFPEWMRLGYASLNELLEGFKWIFVYDTKKNLLTFKGERHVYDLIIPITESGTNKLLCNFYPTNKGEKMIENMLATDIRLYESS